VINMSESLPGLPVRAQTSQTGNHPVAGVSHLAANTPWLSARTNRSLVYRIDAPSQALTEPIAPSPAETGAGLEAARLMEAFLGHTQAVLRLVIERGWASHPTVSRLVSLGFEPGRLLDLRLGLFSNHGEARRALLHCDYTMEQIRAARVLGDARLRGRLVGPVFDAGRRLYSLWAWSPQPQRPRYLYLRRDWPIQVPLLGFGDAPESAPAQLLVVEDLLDALYLRSQGFADAAAIGGPVSQMTAARWQMLAELGVRRVVLAPCWSREGLEAVWDAAQQAARARPSLDVFVLGAEALGTAGAAGLVRQQGAEALWQLLRHVEVHGQSSPREDTARDSASSPSPLPCPATAAVEIEPAIAKFEAETVPAPAAPDESSGAESSPVMRNREPQALSAAPLSPALPGWCELHGCPPTECFCFD